MTTYTITFPHAEGIPIAVHSVTRTWHVSLASVLRLIRLASDRPKLVQLPDGIALELIVNNA